MILVLGGGGQVGTALARASREVWAAPRHEIDVTDRRALARALARRPRAVVNAAAFTAVDAAETARARAFAVNAHGAGWVAAACAAADVPLIHLSTDHVFDGRGGAPYAPGHLPRPVNLYGASKLAGEEAVRGWERHVILRTAWVLGRDTGFVAGVLRRARAGRPLRVVDDQWGQPTPADALARAILAVVDALPTGPWGTWHAAGQPATTWCRLAREALAAARVRVTVGAIPTGAWPACAARPPDARLDTSGFEARFGVSIRWREHLPRLVEAP